MVLPLRPPVTAKEDRFVGTVSVTAQVSLPPGSEPTRQRNVLSVQAFQELGSPASDKLYDAVLGKVKATLEAEIKQGLVTITIPPSPLDPFRLSLSVKIVAIEKVRAVLAPYANIIDEVLYTGERVALSHESGTIPRLAH